MAFMFMLVFLVPSCLLCTVSLREESLSALMNGDADEMKGKRGKGVSLKSILERCKRSGLKDGGFHASESLQDDYGRPGNEGFTQPHQSQQFYSNLQPHKLQQQAHYQ